MSQTLSAPVFRVAAAPRAARPAVRRPKIDWGRVGTHAVTLRDAAGDAMLIGLAVLPALASGAILLTAFGWKVL